MIWEAKAAIQFSLSRLPFGRSAYRMLQDITGSGRLDIHDQYAKKSRFVRWALDHGLSVEGKGFLEIGTGWHPILPVLLHILGAEQTVTIDLNPWLSPRSLADTLEGFESISGRVSADFSLSEDAVREKLKPMLRLSRGGNTPVAEVLRAGNIDYRMPCGASDTGFAPQTFDNVISSNVLEHLPPGVIGEMIVESRRILRAGGIHLHHVNPGDHYSDDKRVSTANFLRYSPRAWYYIGGSGLAYHNRLRCVDYIRMLERAGFRILEDRTSVDPRALEEISTEGLKIHDDYKSYDAEELACYLVDVIAVLE